MEKYKNIGEKAKQGIAAVSGVLRSVSEAYLEQIEGLPKEEQNLIALEYMEYLHTNLCECRIREGIRRHKEERAQRLGAVSEIPDYGDLMTMEDFLDCCKCGGFIDDDGFGHPALVDKMNGEIYLHPSQALRGDYDKRFTHIVWFNR